MATQSQLDFLIDAAKAAKAAGHIFPDMAACEAALESSWGLSELALHANNLFGQKQAHPAIGDSLLLPTREFLHGQWVTVNAVWRRFHSLAESFQARMALITGAAREYPETYGAALKATTPDEYVALVSKTWSTDPARGAKCSVIYSAHEALLKAAVA